MGERLGDTERNILQLIHRNKGVPIREMAREVGISTTAIEKNLTKLKKKGILRRVGADRGGRWEVLGMGGKGDGLADLPKDNEKMK